ncbi:MAG TPA: efflux RND transporter periplasmic adaptor subunit [Candidatus Paceibacterota bacterium]|nr:efflux RND transporter periplasmic adaptor subunit [Candidatus Paceibacterota bacterium]
MKNLLRHNVWILIIIVIVFVGIITTVIIRKNGNHNLFEAKRGDLIISTEVFGRVVPSEEINLAFESTGRVSVINFRIGDEVRAGDIIARLNSAEISSEIDQAIANLESQEAKLREISGSDSDQTKLQSTKDLLVSRLKKSYIAADDIVRNQIDSFISEPNNRFPEFDISLGNFFVRVKIQEERFQIGEMLNTWKKDSDNLSVSDVNLSDAQKFVENLKKVESLLSLISSNSTEFKEYSGKSKAQIDAYLANISQSRNAISTLIIEINSTTESLRSVQAEIPVLNANISSARASIDRLNARSGNYVIRAPFDGVITGRNVELGVVVTAGQKAFSMVSNKPLEIESFVPEINIAGVDVGDPANIKLDAFGDDVIFESVITHIDPRETIKDGVTTYRILLSFNDFHKGILSGMSAEIEIQKEKIIDQLIIPRYLIIRDNNKNYVEISKGKDSVKTEIEIGQRDNMGNVIVLSGLSVGDKIVIPQ